MLAMVATSLRSSEPSFFATSFLVGGPIHSSLVILHSLVNHLGTLDGFASFLRNDGLLPLTFSVIRAQSLTDCLEFHRLSHVRRVRDRLCLLLGRRKLLLGLTVFACTCFGHLGDWLCGQGDHLFLHLFEQRRGDWQLRAVVPILVINKPFRQVARVVPSISVVRRVYQCLCLGSSEHHRAESHCSGIVVAIVVLVIGIELPIIHYRQRTILFNNFKASPVLGRVTGCLSHSCLDELLGIAQLLFLGITDPSQLVDAVLILVVIGMFCRC
mmetsp:Transcript_41764/g.64330  ORF Transcript_41764/g.64330 Transcript_41764/m.64330 type:complete len:270 (-) Transcript_41764:1648-2457(-)